MPQVLTDVGLILWVFLWGFIALKVRDLIMLFAVPAQKAQDSAQNMSTSLGSAADSMKDVPLLGDVLQPPLDSFGVAMSNLVVTIGQFVGLIHTTAIVLAVIVFLVPVVVYLWKWVPWRFAFMQEATAGKKLLPADASPELFALRAIAHAPMHDLIKITPDPMGAWKRGDPEVIRRLADLELGRDGLRLPRKNTLPPKIL